MFIGQDRVAIVTGSAVAPSALTGLEELRYNYYQNSQRQKKSLQPQYAVDTSDPGVQSLVDGMSVCFHAFRPAKSAAAEAPQQR